MNQKKDSVAFLDNVPVTVEFMYDKPRTGKGPYRQWWMFKVQRYDNESKGWVDSALFPNWYLYRLLDYVKVEKNKIYKITLKQRPDDKKKKYWEVVKDKNTTTDMDISNDFEFKPVPLPDEDTTKQDSAPTGTTQYRQSHINTVSDAAGLIAEALRKLVEYIPAEYDIKPVELLPSASTVFIYCSNHGVGLGSAVQQVVDDFDGEEIPMPEEPPEGQDDLPF